MKVMKDNIWNKFFHKKKLQKRKELKRLNDIVMSADDFLPRLKECDSLLGMMHLHKEMGDMDSETNILGHVKRASFGHVMDMKNDAKEKITRL